VSVFRAPLHPLLSKIRYVMVYNKDSAKLDINNPSQNLTNCFEERKDSISITIPQRLLEKNTNCAITTLIITGKSKAFN
jgi:hypothetical protein